MAPTQPPAFNKLVRLLEKRKRDIKWRYRVGQFVKQLRPIADRGYRKSKMERLSKDLRKAGAATVNTTLLWHTRAVANVYCWKEITDLIASGEDFRLTWSHLKPLSEVKNPKVRKQIEDKCINQRLSSNALRLLIRRAKKVDRIGQGGRPPRPPKQFVEGAVRLRIVGKNWLRMCKTFVTGKKASLLGLPPTDKRYDERLQVLLNELKEIQAEVAKAIEQIDLHKQARTAEQKSKQEVNAAKQTTKKKAAAAPKQSGDKKAVAIKRARRHKSARKSAGRTPR